MSRVKYLIAALSLGAIIAAVTLTTFTPRSTAPDTDEYAATIRYVAQVPGGELYWYRILKPLPILVGAALIDLVSPVDALILQSVVFFFLSIVLVFELTYELYGDGRQSAYAAVIFAAAYPMLAYGLVALTDLSGWFFLLLTVLLSIRYLKVPNRKKVFLIGLIAGLGMLFKENTAAATIFFAAFMFLNKELVLADRCKYVLIFGVAFLILPGINTIILLKLYSQSYWSWFMWNWNGKRETLYAYTPLRIAMEVVRVMLLGWLFVAAGIVAEYWHKNEARQRILFALVPASLSVLLWPFLHNRTMYVAGPLLAILASSGLFIRSKNFEFPAYARVVLVASYIVTNFAILEFLLRYGEQYQHRF
jgi:4-amino-4-deoxy-L-arabinose transferase-like glycosyltransferase